MFILCTFSTLAPSYYPSLRACSQIMSAAKEGGGLLKNAEICWQRKEGNQANADIGWPRQYVFRSIVALHSFSLRLCSVKYIVQGWGVSGYDILVILVNYYIFFSNILSFREKVALNFLKKLTHQQGGGGDFDIGWQRGREDLDPLIFGWHICEQPPTDQSHSFCTLHCSVLCV